MMDAIADFFDSQSFLPHGHCFLWEPQILWLHVVSDLIVGLSYFSIPVTILYFARRRKDIPFRYIFALFGIFIVLCGSTHFLSVWVLWHPDYGPEGLVKALTAIVSALTAVLIWKIMPAAIALPSPAELQEMNFRLKETNLKIEQEVASRTAELKQANIKLQASENKLRHIARKSEEQFRMLVDGVTDYAIYMLNPEGIVISWNSGAQRIKGYTATEIIGQHFSRFYTDEDRKAGAPDHALIRAMAEGKFEEETWRVRKDGSSFRAHVVIDTIYDEANNLVGYAKVTRDITEQYAAREALDKTREQLYQAQKMEMVGHLTGGIAHDFNNLLQTVIGGLALVARSILDEKMRNLINTAQKAAMRGARLTQQLLAFSRQQALRPETGDINQIIASFEILLRQACGYGVHVEFDFAPNLWLTDIDPAQFQSGLLNLVINARDAMPSGGTLKIQTRNVTLTQRQVEELKDIQPGPYVMLAVSDTGEGMSAAVKARAIEPFFTTKDIGKGSGLGLSQVYGFVRQSEGQLDIQSEVGRGTTLRLYLPKSNKAKTENPQTAPDAQKFDEKNDYIDLIQEGPANAGKVLVVEDDPLVLTITAEAVRSFGYEVYAAANAREALAIVDRGEDIDILFTDVVMPEGMNGMDLMREVLKRRLSIRVLMASGYSREILAAKEGVANTFIMNKPYDINELSQRLKDLMAKS